MPNDLLFQNLSTVQSSAQQQGPTTIASAATINPVSYLTRLTGTTPVSTIVPPVSGAHQLAFLWTTGTSGAFAASGGSGAGQIAVAKTTVTNVLVIATYDPRTTLYYFN